MTGPILFYAPRGICATLSGGYWCSPKLPTLVCNDFDMHSNRNCCFVTIYNENRCTSPPPTHPLVGTYVLVRVHVLGSSDGAIHSAKWLCELILQDGSCELPSVARRGGRLSAPFEVSGVRVCGYPQSPFECASRPRDVSPRRHASSFRSTRFECFRVALVLR